MPLPLLAIAGGFGNFLLKNWKLIVILVVILGAWWHYKGLLNTIADQKQTIAEQKATIKKKDDEIARLKDTLQQAKEANDTLIKEVKKQNDAINELEKVQKANAARIAILSKNIDAERVKVKTLILELKNRPLAQDCETAIQELRDAPRTFTPLNLPPPTAGPASPSGGPSR